ncbi:MAG: PepSY-associated TM helix domain-containing protein [Propionicimonas sp.]
MSAAAPASVATPAPERRMPNPRATTHKWTRRLHSWLSLVSLLVVLFFAVTGLTLNHQDWTFGQEPVTTTTTGTLPEGSVTRGTIDFLAVSEYLRATQGASGEITDHGVDGSTGRVTYQGPGYTATATFETSTRAFSLASTRYGLVAIANDLHKGRHTSQAWSWLIDIAAVGLALVAITGLLLQLFIARSRRLGLILVGIGVVAGIVLVLLS